MKRSTALFLIVVQLFARPVGACVNTRYSRAEEEQITGDVVRLIMGQFAHHGPAFYQEQLRVTAKELAADPDNVEARNDRAVAFLKLARYNEAIAEFEKIERTAPNRYRTHANLGVLHKKLGDFPRAAEHIEKSLAIQPGGHLGLGDYYLRMIRWLGRIKDMRNSGEEPVNFLNIPYAAGSAATAEAAVTNREFLETLIKADHRFTDALFVLGDVLLEAGDTELAYRAYERARMLDHPFSDRIRDRQRQIRKRWEKELPRKEGYILPGTRFLRDEISRETRQAEKWVAAFQAQEAKLLDGSGKADFAVVKSALKEAGVEEPTYLMASFIKGEEINHGGPKENSMWLVGAGLVVLLLIVGGGFLFAVIRRAIGRFTGRDDPLNLRFGHGGTIRFRRGLGGLTRATIRNEHATAEVYLHGGHVTAFQPHGKREVLWMSEDAVFAPPKAIRGGVPVCWPWFGPHPTDPDKPQHGFARNQRWSVNSAEMFADGRTRLSLILRSDAHTRAHWPHVFELELDIIVGRELRLELVSRNTGEEPFVVGGALHTYFALDDINRARVEGLDGREYLDQLDGMARKRQDGAIRVAEEVDRIYVDTEDECRIVDEAADREIHVGKEGSRSTVVWNPWTEKSKRMGDYPDEGYRTMICIETTNADEDLHTVEPGGEHRMVQVISPA